MDELDAGIVRLLGVDGRMTNKAVAQAMGVSEVTIATRIRTMLAGNAVRIIAQRSAAGDPEAAILAILDIYVEHAADIEQAGAVLSRFDAVFSAYETARRPELCAYVRAPSVAALKATVQEMAGQMPPLARLDILPVLDVHRLHTSIVNLRHPPPPRTPPRDLGEALIAELEQDGRQSVRALADKLGLSQTATHHRLSRLLGRDGMRVVLVADAEALGFNVWADIRVAVAPHLLPGAVERLMNHPDITVIAQISGAMNLEVFVAARSMNDLDLFVREHIRSLPGLIDFALMRVPRVVKYDFNYSF